MIEIGKQNSGYREESYLLVIYCFERFNKIEISEIRLQIILSI